MVFLWKMREKGKRVGEGGVGTGKGTGKSMRTRVSKLSFSKLPFSKPPKVIFSIFGMACGPRGMQVPAEEDVASAGSCCHEPDAIGTGLSSRAGRRRGFKRGVFPICTFLSLFVLLGLSRIFWDFPAFFGHFPDWPFSSFSAYSLC